MVGFHSYFMSSKPKSLRLRDSGLQKQSNDTLSLIPFSDTSRGKRTLISDHYPW